jgi:hypothetical protein
MILTDDEHCAYLEQGFFVRQSVFLGSEVALLQSASQHAVDRARQLSEPSLIDSPFDTSINCGRAYVLDNAKFVDHEHITVQFEHAQDSTDVRVIEPINDLVPAFDELLDDDRLLAPMRGLIGQQALALWTAKLNLKPALCGSGFGWHQDSPYWIHDCEHVDLLPNVMLTLDPFTLNNGALQVVPGSHVQGRLPGCTDGRQLAGFYTDPSAFDASAAQTLVVAAGSCIFFSPHLVHGSGPNQSEQQRRAVIMTYQPGGFAALKSGQLRAVGGPALV